MKTISQLLQNKSRGVCTIEPDARVYDALKLMAEKDVKLTVAKTADIVPRSGTGWKVVQLKCQPLFSLDGKNSSFIGEHIYARVGGKWVCVD